MIKELNDKLEPVIKKKGRKKSEKSFVEKGIGLFDHIKHIRSIQDPDYFKNLEDIDKKSFNHFMILKALSMNPALLEDVSYLFKFFDKIPSPQFYTLLIGLIPIDKKFYPWIKISKKPFSKQLLELVAKYFEVSEKEAEGYVLLLLSMDKGKDELINLCKDFGLENKEIELAMKGNSDE